METIYCGYLKYHRGFAEKNEREQELRYFCESRGITLFSIMEDMAGRVDGIKAAVQVVQKGLAAGIVVSASNMNTIKVPEGVSILPTVRCDLFRGGWIAFGWRLRAGVLEPHPKEQAIIGTVRLGKECGLSWHQIASAMNNQGIQRRNGRPWDRNSVYQLLKVNPVGAGEVA